MEALEALGFSKDKVFGFDLPDNAMDGLPLIEIVRTIQELFDQLTPDVIYTHHPGDLNVDHRAAYDATMVLARPQPGNTVKEIYTFEVASSTGWSGHSRGSAFTPSHYVGIGAYWEKKRKALEAYKDEMRDAPHARSIESLEAQARFRGSQVGLTMAEAFCVERAIV